MGTPRNFTNNASGASLNGSLASGATSALLNNYSNFPAAPFTATISRNQTDEELVLVTAVSGSTVTITRGYDGSTAQAHTAGASFEHTAIAKDFRDASSHVESTGAVHGLGGNIVGDTDSQTLTNKTVQVLKALATASGAAVEADNTGGATGKLFRGLQAGVEKFFVDYQGNLTAQGFTGTTASFSGTLGAAATTLASLGVTGTTTFTGAVTANGGITVGAGQAVTTPLMIGTTRVDLGQSATDQITGTASRSSVFAKTDFGLYFAPTGQSARRAAMHWGSGVAFPTTGVIAGDTYLHTGLGCYMRYSGSAWRQAEVSVVADAAARTAISTTYSALLYGGFEVVETATSRRWQWASGGWQYLVGGTTPLVGVTINTGGGWSQWNAGGYSELSSVSYGSDGEVKLHAILANGSAIPSSGTFANPITIPAGYRPATSIVRSCRMGGGPGVAPSTFRFNINADGTTALEVVGSVAATQFWQFDAEWRLVNS